MKFRLFISLICIFVLPGVSSAATPKSLAGVTLGTNLSEISDKVDMGSALPLWRSEYLAKVSLKPIEGYRSGYVLYGNCKNNGRIVRIKMTYENYSKEFYDRLRSLLEKRYGKPSEWRGNPFGTLKNWKWSLKDADKNSVSIILERYEGDDESFTHGNSIRLTNATLMEAEKKCFETKAKETHPGKAPGGAAATPNKLNFDWYLPQ
jgi:hypothetical protein